MKALGPEDAAVLLQIADGGGGPIHINPMFWRHEDYELSSINVLRATGLLEPVVDISSHETGLNRVRFSAFVGELRVSSFGIAFLQAVGYDCSELKLPGYESKGTEHHFVPRFEE